MKVLACESTQRGAEASATIAGHYSGVDRLSIVAGSARVVRSHGKIRCHVMIDRLAIIACVVDAKALKCVDARCASNAARSS